MDNYQQGTITWEHQSPEFLLGFYYVGMIDWIIHHGIELNTKLLPTPWGSEVRLISCGSKLNTLSDWSFWYDQLPSWNSLETHHESPYLHKLRCGLELTMKNRYSFYHSGNCKDLEALSQEPGTKTKQFLYYTAALLLKANSILYIYVIEIFIKWV